MSGWVCRFVSDPSQSQGKRCMLTVSVFSTVTEEDAVSGAVPGAKTESFHFHACHAFNCILSKQVLFLCIFF